MLLHKETCAEKTFKHGCFAQRGFCTAQPSRTGAFTHTAAFGHRHFHTQMFFTQKLLQRTGLTQRIFPPKTKIRGKHIFQKGSFSFPVVSRPDSEGQQWMTLGYPYFCLSFGFLFAVYKWHDARARTSSTHRTLRSATFTWSSFYAHMILHREVCVQKNFYRQLWKSALFSVFLFSLPSPLPFLFSFPSLLSILFLWMVIVLTSNKVECQGRGQSWEIAVVYLPVCHSVLMYTSAVDFMLRHSQNCGRFLM